jgi:hypothetical protein
MGLINAQKKKNVIWLAVTSVIASVFFSFLSAPLLRTLSVTVKGRVFWLLGTVLVSSLFFIGSNHYVVSETAVYVGATWMTLGAYSELEKRGISWKVSGLVSLVIGLLFALAGYYLVMKNQSSEDVLQRIVEPLKKATVEMYPNFDMEKFKFENFILGMLGGFLSSAILISIIFEPKIARLFNIKRERIVTGLRWLEFRLPDAAIWIVLVSIFVLVQNWVNLEWLSILAINLLLVFVAPLFFQGVAVVEFMLRVSRSGPIMRSITYLIMILQLMPFVVVLGLVDYWADFRRLFRRRAKQIN